MTDSSGFIGIIIFVCLLSLLLIPVVAYRQVVVMSLVTHARGRHHPAAVTVNTVGGVGVTLLTHSPLRLTPADSPVIKKSLLELFFSPGLLPSSVSSLHHKYVTLQRLHSTMNHFDTSPPYDEQ